MTRSTHSKSRKPRNKKQILQKRGSRKPQRGGAWSDYLPSFLKYNKVDPSLADSQSKANELQRKLSELTKIMGEVELCSKEVKQNTAEADEQKREQEERLEKERLEKERLEKERLEKERLEKERLQQAASSEPMVGGMNSRRNSRSNRRSNRRGRGRAPPKKGKKGMVVGPRKGVVAGIF